MKFYIWGKLVHENDWKGEDVHIKDIFHSAGCWGDCYREEDFLHLKGKTAEQICEECRGRGYPAGEYCEGCRYREYRK